MTAASDWVHAAPDDARSCLVRVKAVPGASRDAIAGVLALPDGARLKLRTSAPPESGKANKALCALLAGALGASAKQVTLEAGHASALKTFRVEGVSAADARSRVVGGS